MKYSIIIPHKDVPELLNRCLMSVPERDDIEVFVADDNSKPNNALKAKGYCESRKNVTFIPLTESKGAGRARNAGLDRASGQWLIFADSDDFFDEGFWTFVDSVVDADGGNDIYYFKVRGVDSDTLEPVKRGTNYNSYVKNLLAGKRHAEDRIRFFNMVPWSKVYKHSFIKANNIRFEEVMASNDVMFATYAGAKAGKIAAYDKVMYVVTSRSGSLVKQTSSEVLRCRFDVYLRQNQYLNSIGKSMYIIDLIKPMKKAMKYYGIAELGWYFKRIKETGVNPLASVKKKFNFLKFL